MKITAKISWQLSEEDQFIQGKYSRAHLWTLDNGVTLQASASPDIVPLPYSNPDYIDPEEAFLASVSSCHMLWFLSIASSHGCIVTSYVDDALATMTKNMEGKICITEVTLRPKIEWENPQPPSDEISEFHRLAHESCFIANSIKSEITIENQTD